MNRNIEFTVFCANYLVAGPRLNILASCRSKLPPLFRVFVFGGTATEGRGRGGAVRGQSLFADVTNFLKILRSAIPTILFPKLLLLAPCSL